VLRTESGFAKPKSTSFAPVRVIMTLPGFRPRCAMPLRCALSRAPATCDPIFRTCSKGSGPFSKGLASVSVLMPNVVKNANMRVVQTGNCFCFTLEALFSNDIGGKLHRKNFDCNRAVKTRVETSPMPPAPSGERISYGPS
jgi:hypothetical protein